MTWNGAKNPVLNKFLKYFSLIAFIARVLLVGDVVRSAGTKSMELTSNLRKYKRKGTENKVNFFKIVI